MRSEGRTDVVEEYDSCIGMDGMHLKGGGWCGERERETFRSGAPSKGRKAAEKATGRQSKHDQAVQEGTYLTFLPSFLYRTSYLPHRPHFPRGGQVAPSQTGKNCQAPKLR